MPTPVLQGRCIFVMQLAHAHAFLWLLLVFCASKGGDALPSGLPVSRGGMGSAGSVGAGFDVSEKDIGATRQYNMRIDLSNEGGLSATTGAKSALSDDDVRGGLGWAGVGWCVCVWGGGWCICVCSSCRILLCLPWTCFVSGIVFCLAPLY
jgi:hypothetical protein